MIDLRTDTVTVPSPEMREAMAAARVGDDFYREDPTVIQLEAEAAAVLGKEAALYVPSGTMANLLAHLTHVPGGGEVVGPDVAHSFTSEGGGPARVAGITLRAFPQARAEVDLDRLTALIRPRSMLAQGTALIWLEQPTRGYVVSLDDLAAIRRLADERRVPVHFDGARVFNAAIALGVAASDVAAYADTLMFCVSKGLAAPIGSLLVGPAEFIERARLNRQMLGGGMRQAGIVAAGGLFAIRHNVARLAADHANAQRLADGLRTMPGLVVDRDVVETNIFYVDLVRDDMTPTEFVDRLHDAGVHVNRPSAGRRTVRFVTHYGIEAADIEAALAIVARVLEAPTPVATAGTAGPG